MTSKDILISEVGPRDGLQTVKRTMATAAKIEWIRALAAAGLAEIEIGSFVNPRALPQMADTAEVAAAVIDLPDVGLLALFRISKAPNGPLPPAFSGSPCRFSASRAHSLANINMTPEQAVEQVRAVVALRDALPDAARRGVEVGISTAFGCTIEGAIPEDAVIRLAVNLAAAGADSVGLSDTTGMGNPAQVKRLFTRLRAELGSRAGGAHLHNTRGQGLANVWAALDAGVTTFDSSQAGLGGCPYAPAPPAMW